MKLQQMVHYDVIYQMCPLNLNPISGLNTKWYSLSSFLNFAQKTPNKQKSNRKQNKNRYKERNKFYLLILNFVRFSAMTHIITL